MTDLGSDEDPTSMASKAPVATPEGDLVDESTTHNAEDAPENSAAKSGDDAADEAAPSSLIARLPFEILASILAEIAIDSPKAFVRSQLVGRPFWVPHDSALLWEPICRSIYTDMDASLHVDDYGSYYNMFRQCPAVRHDGVYVCMSRYFRDGEPDGISWTKPRHEVRYYRYLWLEADGSCRSLLANHGPQQLLGPNAAPGAARAYRQDVMVGRWELDRTSKELRICVDGGRRRCQFYFEMLVRSSGGKVHNKLRWQRYYCKDGTGSSAEFKTETEGSYYFVKHRADGLL